MPIAAGRAIEELRRFRQSGAQTELTALVDGDDGTLVNERIAPYGGVFLLAPELRIGAGGCL